MVTYLRDYITLDPDDDDADFRYGYRHLMVVHFKQDLYSKNFGLQNQGKYEKIDTLQNRIKFWPNFNDDTGGTIPIHHSIKLTPLQAIKKSNERKVYSNLQDKRRKLNPKFKLGQLVRTADIKRVFSHRDSTNYSYKFYTITEVIHDTIPS